MPRGQTKRLHGRGLVWGRDHPSSCVALSGVDGTHGDAIQHSALAGATVARGKGSNRNGATQSTSTSTKLTQVQRLLPAFRPMPEQQSLQFPARKPHLVCSTQASDSDEAAVTQKGLRFHKAAKNADNPLMGSHNPPNEPRSSLAVGTRVWLRLHQCCPLHCHSLRRLLVTVLGNPELATGTRSRSHVAACPMLCNCANAVQVNK